MISRQNPSPLSRQRRRILGAAGAGLAGLMLPTWAVAASVWRQLEAAVSSVGEAPVLEKGLELTLPLVAEDGSSVPLTINANGLKGVQIDRLEIYAPANPTAEVAIFEFGPGMGTVNLATRIRLSESQTVVAIAHTNDGRAIVAERAVRVTVSGCIAPAKSDPAAEMKARVRVPKKWSADSAGEVLTMISHPMITGLAADETGHKPATRVIESFEVSLNGQSVLTAKYFRSLAANPYLKFEFAPSEEGELHFKWVEDTGKAVELNEMVHLA